MTDDIMGSTPASVMSTDAQALKDRLMEMILWAEKTRPRSVQVELGPSDLGSACDRRIGYKLAGIPEVNGFLDPWVTFVGSAIHSRLQESIDKYQDFHAIGNRYLTESNAPLDEFIKAHPDLLDREEQMVIDHKSTNSDILKKLREGLDPVTSTPGYIIQVQLYGLAFERLGYPIKKVALAFYPRNGRLRDMFCWVGDYDRDVALAAWSRPYEIVDLLTTLGVETDSRQWARVPSLPSDACGICPWFDARRAQGVYADDTGCPGR